MILKQRQQQLNSVFNDLEGFNRRRAYISTQYVLASERYGRTLNDTDREDRENYFHQLESIDMQINIQVKKLRSIQSLYLVEYDYEYIEGISEVTSIFRHHEELYFFTSCNINTFQNGWDLEEEDVQELLFEIADFILIHRYKKFFIRNIKNL